MDTTAKVILQNDIRLLERDKKKAQEELSRLDDLKRNEFKNFQTTKDVHVKQLWDIQEQIRKLREGFEILKKACEKAEKDLATYNANELLQAKKKTDEMFLEAQNMLKGVKDRELKVMQDENSVKVRELSVDKREANVNEKDVTVTQKEKDLSKREDELHTNLVESSSKLVENQTASKLAIETKEKAEIEEKNARQRKIAIESEIEAKFAEAAKKKFDAEVLIKQYTILIENLSRTKEELRVLKVQLDDRQGTLQRAIKEWQQKGVVIHG